MVRERQLRSNTKRTGRKCGRAGTSYYECKALKSPEGWVVTGRAWCTDLTKRCVGNGIVERFWCKGTAGSAGGDWVARAAQRGFAQERSGGGEACVAGEQGGEEEERLGAWA